MAEAEIYTSPRRSLHVYSHVPHAVREHTVGLESNAIRSKSIEIRKYGLPRLINCTPSVCDSQSYLFHVFLRSNGILFINRSETETFAATPKKQPEKKIERKSKVSRMR